ncbi:hypothetical protein V7148_11390 [Gottfriedia acidiceleris]|uniref:hypothetical protein n=1 Tax=Gottfriedia acidiceleris TaxID=371036 RepID=UPI002FFF1D0A
MNSRRRYRAQEAFNEKNMFLSGGKYVKKFNSEREGLLIVNDSTSDLTFKAGATSFTVKPGETFNEIINPFVELQITCSGSFRGYIKEEF